LHDEGVARQRTLQMRCTATVWSADDDLHAIWHQNKGIWKAIQSVQQALEAHVCYASAYGL
jgi:hypothetical protein